MTEIYYLDIESIDDSQLQKAYTWISEDKKQNDLNSRLMKKNVFLVRL